MQSLSDRNGCERLFGQKSQAMSFDIYVQSYQNGASCGIPRQRVREVFGPHLSEVQPNHWKLRYDHANSCDIDLKSDEADGTKVSDFSVHRPCGDERLWDALASVLTIGNLVLYFPGGRPFVGRSSVIEHLPSDLIEALGQPLVVTSGGEIQRELQMT
jgi:hypothetical protein